MKVTEEAASKASSIRLVIFDVDGTLTDGNIYMGAQGELMKAFSARDGMGITLAHKSGLKTAIITGRSSEIVASRARELKISAVWQGASDKRSAYEEAKALFQVTDAEIAYVGDDLNDLPLLSQAGLACAVGDAMPEVKQLCSLVAENYGGNGAVREILEYIIKRQGKWDEAIAAFSAKPAVVDVAQ